MRSPPASRRARLRLSSSAACLLLAVAASLVIAGCGGTGSPQPISASALAEAQSFPYFKVYWAGPRFEGHALSAADGLRGYISYVGDSVYYGDCVQSKGIFGGGSCLLPLQVTTVVYELHRNATLGPQRNILSRGVPAVVYDEGRSIELYTGKVAIDIFSDDFAHAIAATRLLRPLNAAGSASANLPPPVYCPMLAGLVPADVARALEKLPGHVCQQAAAAEAIKESLKS